MLWDLKTSYPLLDSSFLRHKFVLISDLPILPPQFHHEFDVYSDLDLLLEQVLFQSFITTFLTTLVDLCSDIL